MVNKDVYIMMFGVQDRHLFTYWLWVNSLILHGREPVSVYQAPVGASAEPGRVRLLVTVSTETVAPLQDRTERARLTVELR